MATYLACDALRLPAASLLANSGLCVNIEIEIWLLLGVNVDTALCYCYFRYKIIYLSGLTFEIILLNCTRLFVINGTRIGVNEKGRECLANE